VNTTDKLAEALRLAREWFRHEEAGEGPQADDVIKAADEALAAHDAEQAQAAKAVPADLRSAAERTRQDLGPTGSNYPDVRVLLAFVEQALAAPTPPAPEAKSCLITGTCKHGSWCSEVYCQEHCQFVEAQAAPEAQQPAGRASVDDWERELSAVMPADFKDWWQNSRREWPAVAAEVIKSLRLDRDAGWEVAALAQRREQQ
jgi:hypothetical protein